MGFQLSASGSVYSDSYRSLRYDCGGDNGLVRSRELDNNRALDKFLSGVEKRAFRMAQIATNNPDEALDIVQDAMFKLVEKYASKGQDEWGALFYRILQSRIRDWYRRTSVRNRYRSWFSSPSGETGEVEQDPFQNVEDLGARSPEQELGTGMEIEVLEQALRELPLRQQQVFLLRAWEGLSVKETAKAMGCAEGSVKTHYSRATHTLRDKLGGDLE
jgi:RNA polymerase sigma-70 factor, ECF subfamily